VHRFNESSRKPDDETFSLPWFFLFLLCVLPGGGVLFSLNCIGWVRFTAGAGCCFSAVWIFSLSMRLLELHTLRLITTFFLACIVVLGCRMGYRYGLYLFCLPPSSMEWLIIIWEGHAGMYMRWYMYNLTVAIAVFLLSFVSSELESVQTPWKQNRYLSVGGSQHAGCFRASYEVRTRRM
jgi:hypothetical protein